MASIDLKGVSVEFPIYDARTRSLKNRVFGIGRQMMGRVAASGQGQHVIVKALHGITLSLRDGDRVGLIGRNGAGKTTMLRVLSGIYEPPVGTIDIVGSVASMTDITMGMDPDASGYDNIIMRGVFLGMTKPQAREKIAEIEDFTELGEHLELPIRTYSNGMLLRLAFAISTCVTPEILIMDEVIGTGDAHFVEKAQARVRGMIDRARILALASHDDKIMESFCDKAILLDEGRLVDFGPVRAILNQYERLRS